MSFGSVDPQKQNSGLVAASEARICGGKKKNKVVHSSTAARAGSSVDDFIHVFCVRLSSWWFQLVWKILVKMGISTPLLLLVATSFMRWSFRNFHHETLIAFDLPLVDNRWDWTSTFEAANFHTRLFREKEMFSMMPFDEKLGLGFFHLVKVGSFRSFILPPTWSAQDEAPYCP